MTKITRRKWFRSTALLFFLAVALTQMFAMARAPLPRDDYSDYIVRDLKAEDMPNDDGGGLLLSWEPLAAEARIIEYRVYRGSSEDQLFLVGTVPINPRTGFLGDRVFYYDSGFNIMSTVNSPRRLRAEVQQVEGSPLYQEVPRDLNAIEHKFEKYTVLGVIPQKNYYYRANKVEIPGEEGEESQFYAGLKDRQFQQILYKMKADNPYYYSVVAVSEQRRYYPYAPIVKGIPRINRPESPRRFYPILVQDSDKLQFEWTQPLVTDGVGRVNIYFLAKEDVNRFDRYVEQLKLADENRLDRLDNPGIDPFDITALNPARHLFSQGFSSINYAYSEFEDNRLTGSGGNLVIDRNVSDINDYYAVMSLSNHWGHESFGTPVEIRVVDSQDLPEEPVFAVIDKPNDKGDANLIYWDEPVVFLTNSSFQNEERTRVTINYDFETNDQYEVKNIYFDVFDDEGVQIGSRINEFYQNLFFNIRLPEKYDINSPEYDIARPINIEMRVNVSGNDLLDDYVITQKMTFDEDYMAFMPQDPYLRGSNISKYTYSIYKKPYAGESFRLSSRTAGIIREADDSIRYESTVTQLIAKVLPEQQLYLFNTAINAFYDKEVRRPVNTHLFSSLAERENEKNRQEYSRLQSEYQQADREEEISALQARIENYEWSIGMSEHEFMQEVNRQPNDRARMKLISERREREMRTFQYKMVKSDGEGNFVETDVYVDEDGNSYFFPEPNWFNTDRSATLVASLLWGFIVFWMIRRAKQGKDMYIRPIAGIEEIDNAIGRATEMGRPILFNPGLDGIGSVATLAGLNILGRVAKKAAEYDTRILVPVRDVITLPIAQEIIKEAHYEAGRPDTYEKNSAFFITTQQFAFVAGVNGVMVREKCATCFYMGMYYAEALIMTEVGNTIGAVQIAGTDAVTQVPFFITTCDYTLIGEELYGASAYLTREPMMMGTLKATDVAKFIILVCMITGAILSTFRQTFFINLFPDQ